MVVNIELISEIYVQRIEGGEISTYMDRKECINVTTLDNGYLIVPSFPFYVFGNHFDGCNRVWLLA